MPPEQFPWDRRDFRKHDRSGSDPRFGSAGGFGGGWTHRWREPPHHPNAPPPFQHPQPQQPWYSDFRTPRPIPSGHVKQGGWNMYPDEAGPVFMPFGSRYNDRDVADYNFRPFGSRGDAKYLRNDRESRGSVSQKDCPGRPTTEVDTKVNNQKAVQNIQTCHKVNNHKAGEDAQTCHKVNNHKAGEDAQTCHKGNNQKAGENTQTFHNANNLKVGENAQTFRKANSQKVGENDQTCNKMSNQKATENAQTCSRVNNQKVGEDAQTCNKVINQKATENAQTCSKVNNRKALEDTLTCHKVNNEKAIENTRTCHKNDSVSNDSAYSLRDLLSSPSQPLLKEKHEKKDVTATLVSSGPNTDKENGLGAIDWKPLKWSRSGSFVSRGSSFSHSSSSKSLGVDSIDIMADVQQKDVTLAQSPAACAMPSAPDPSDETTPRKKPRLGWGEGLAKYEKKRVDGHEEDSGKDRLAVSATSTGTMQSPCVSQVDKSPRFSNMSDCASPATPASVACSSSPGITGSENKESIKAPSADHSTANLSCSPGIMYQIHDEGPAFNLENLELTSIANLSSLINDLLQSNDPSSVETGYVRMTSLNKLLVCKVDILKALEVTESEIDSLETELKSLLARSNGCYPCQAVYSSQPGERLLEPCDEHAASSGYTAVATPLQIASPGHMVDEDTAAALEVENMEVKDKEIDSPGTATSKLVRALSSGEDTCTSKTTECVEGSVKLGLDNSSNLNQTSSESGLSHQNIVCLADVPTSFLSCCQNNKCVGNVHYVHIYDSILAYNKESETRGVEGLNSLLPDKMRVVDISTLSRVSAFQRDPLVIKEKFLARKQSQRFKEKVIAIKFKVFRHFWKEGRVVSVRKLRGKAHKMFNPSRTGYKRNRSFMQSRISYFAGSHQIVPTEEVIELLNGLLSASPFKPCQNSLKMPCFILDKEVRMSRFISNNGLVEDPSAAEEERSTINPWMAEEKEIFIDKLADFGKNFSKIASFLEHKTIADCIEFYYKNHKSECFEHARKKPDKQSKPQANTYLVAAGKRSSREVNAVNLDVLGDASVIAAAVNASLESQQSKSRSRILSDAASSRKMPRGDDGPLQRSNSLDMYSNETAAADVLAGICGSLSSEAMSSCITSSFEPARANSSIKRPLTPDVTQNIDECSDESCAEMDSTDWTDEEKSIFIRAMSSYGKDFARISQCLGTKTNEQCRIFFSKARKCLGLDQIHPGTGNVDSEDLNGGGSDIEDDCVVQNGSVICSDDSENKIEENLNPHEMKMDHTADTAESHKLKPDVNICGEGIRTCPLDSIVVSPVLKKSSVSSYQVDDKPVIDINASSRDQDGANGSELGARTMCVSSNSNSIQVEVGFDLGLPHRSSEADNKVSAEVPVGHVQGNLESEKVEYRDANLVDVAFLNGVSELKPGHQLGGNASHPYAVAHSSVQVESGPPKEADLQCGSAKASHVISSQQNSHFASLETCTLFSVPIKYQTHSVRNALPNGTTGDSQQKHSGNLLSSHILRRYPVPVHAMKDFNVDVNSQKVLPDDVPSRDGMLHLDGHADLSLRNCTGSRHQNEVFKAPCSSQGHRCGDKSRPQSGCSSSSDKPARNGDVKLFGKILVSSQQEPNSSEQESGPDNSQHRGSGGQSLNLKLSSDEKLHSHSSKPKFDWNNYLGTENIPIGSFGIWDGNKAQTGVPVLDSTLLLTKYPAAFADHSIPPAKLEQPPVQRVPKSNDHPLNGSSVIPRELSGNTVLPEFPVLRNRELQQPLIADMRQLQDGIFSEMQRRNGFEVMTGMQQQARMKAGINNVVGRVLHGKQYEPGTSNPVNAVKMHYGNAQNFNMQAGIGWRMDK